jgi:hypothetical protein
MLQACLYTICFVFSYTSWHFYAFSRTSLLTRWHSAIPCFLLFLCFRKVTQEILSELDETKAKPPNIYRSFQKTEEVTERGQGPASPPGGAASPWQRPPVVRAPWSTPDAAPSPVKTPRRENLNTRSIFQKHIVIRRRCRPEIGRVQKLFPTPCWRGESLPEVFFIAMLASDAMSE